MSTKSKPCNNSKNLIESMISADPFGSINNPHFWAFRTFGRRALAGCIRAGWIKVEDCGMKTVWSVSELGRLAVGQKPLKEATIFINYGKI